MRLREGLALLLICATGCSSTPGDPAPAAQDEPTPPPPPPPPPPATLALSWPVGRALHDGLYLMNYVDHGRGDGPRDYRCGRRTFDGHSGVDLSLTSFRAMDQGTPVYAAAPGRVTVAAYHEFDRNYETPYVGTINNVNMVQIAHADGSSAWYAHLRRNSVAVAVGDSVTRGQFLGMIGSSGWSPVPHLHFEVWSGVAFGSAILDPFGQPCDRPPSRWDTVPAYVGGEGVLLYDADVTLDLALEGVFGNILGIRALKDRLDRPAVIGSGEARLGIWFFHQSPQGGAVTITITRPDGSVFSDVTRTTQSGQPFTWEVLSVPFAGTTPPHGTWTLTARTATRTIERRFAVGDSTAFGPRFHPLAGRSLRLSGAPVRDTLRLRHGLAGLTLRLDSAPPGVRLEGDEVVAEGAQLAARNAAFRVIAEDALGRADTMHYHLVDPARPVNPSFGRSRSGGR